MTAGSSYRSFLFRHGTFTLTPPPEAPQDQAFGHPHRSLQFAVINMMPYYTWGSLRDILGVRNIGRSRRIAGHGEYPLREGG